MRRSTILRLSVAVGASVLTWRVLARSPALRRWLHEAESVARSRSRHLRNRWQGARYRFAGRGPNPWVDDDVLADRVRSSLGPLEKQLDLPHVHVQVHDHFAHLHGEVASQSDVDDIVHAAVRVPGVFGVQSLLHIGLGSGDTRPSAGPAHVGPSDARRRLLGAATRAGVPEEQAGVAVRAVLRAFANRLPDDERAQVLAHLPRDARRLAEPAPEVRQPPRIRTVAQLVADAVDRGLVADDEVGVTQAILEELRDLVPEEARDVEAVLPTELREIWTTAVPR